MVALRQLGMLGEVIKTKEGMVIWPVGMEAEKVEVSFAVIGKGRRNAYLLFNVASCDQAAKDCGFCGGEMEDLYNLW